MKPGTWEVLDAVVDAKGIRRGRPTAGQTTGGKHATGSLHYIARARDYGLADSDAHAISKLFAPVAARRPDLIPELSGSDGTGYDEGKPYQAPGHTNHHTHVAIGPGVGLAELLEVVGAPASAGMTGRPGGGNWDGSDAEVAPASNAGASGGRIGELADIADRAAAKATPAFGLRVIYVVGGVLGLTVAAVGILRATGVLDKAGQLAQTIPHPAAQVGGAVARGIG
jgi:hypothetical protein